MKKISLLVLSVFVVFVSCEPERYYEENNYYYGDPTTGDPTTEDPLETQSVGWAASYSRSVEDTLVNHYLALHFLTNDRFGSESMVFEYRVRFRDSTYILFQNDFEAFGRDDYLGNDQYPETDYKYVYHTLKLLSQTHTAMNDTLRLRFLGGYAIIQGHYIPMDSGPYRNWTSSNIIFEGGGLSKKNKSPRYHERLFSVEKNCRKKKL